MKNMKFLEALSKLEGRVAKLQLIMFLLNSLYTFTVQSFNFILQQHLLFSNLFDFSKLIYAFSYSTKMK